MKTLFINLKMPSFLRQGNLPNRASKIKRLLARMTGKRASVLMRGLRASVKLHF